MKYAHLTIPQQNIWNLQRYYKDTAVANLCGAVFYQEKRDSKLLNKSICQFIENHSGLSLRFCETDNPVQYVSEEIDSAIPVKTFSSENEFENYAKTFANEPIGLVDTSMYQFIIFYIGNRSGILVKLSHMVADAWTFGLMANQVNAAYCKLAGKDDNELFHSDYLEYVQTEDAYLVSERYEKDRQFWNEKYTKRPETSPVKLCTAQSASITAKRLTDAIPLSLEEKIRHYCKINPVTEAVLFETAIFIYLSHVNPENQSVTIGVPVLNRSNVKEKRMAGMFVSTLPLTVSISDSMTVSELTREITKGHMELFRHQKYPYSDILKSLREKQNFSGNLYDVMVSYQNAKTNTDADTKWYTNGYSEVPFVMHIDNRDGNDCHTINIDYQTAVFGDESEIKYIIKRLEYIIEQITEDSSRTVNEICIVPKQEQHKLILDFNDTYVDYPRDKCVHELFSEQAERTPDKIALIFEDKKFTYKQLDEMSNSLAHFLREKGVKPNDVVPIIAKRSWHVIVAMLGIMKAGGAYMPVDPGFPVERIASMVAIAESKIGLVYGFDKKLNVEIVDLIGFDFNYNELEIENINHPEDTLYVIFTSGSTGIPKGIMVSHRNVNNYSHRNDNNVCRRIIKNGYENIISVTNIVFDIFVTESILPLLNGMCIYFANDLQTASQGKLSQVFEKNGIDILQTTPTKMRSYILDKSNTKYLQRLKTIILGGEPLYVDLYHELKRYTSADIYNIYGPAETTVWSSNAKVTDDDITIGKPIANTQIYILDKENNPVPIGVAGELCIAGEGVGKGYLNNPELTAEKFVPNPFATEENHHGKTMYHTGDLARWRPDGEIEYLGRIDTQVKIRGLRIELGEIESVMSSMEGIGLTAAADKRDESNRQYLVGYYTSDRDIDERRLREHLAQKLPKYMVPNYFVHLSAMPMTPSGKIDRKNLPLPDFTAQTKEYTPPETEQEIQLCHLLEKILHVERIGIQDDFFELGGDSLTAIEYVAKAHGIGIDFALQNVFDYSTVKSLCDFLKNGDVSRIQYEVSDFQKYQKLLSQNVIEDNIELKKKSLGNIFLTGATGFLGAHVLEQLLVEETGKIYCLVRGNNTSTPFERLKCTLQYYFGNQYEAELGLRIIPVEGDIECEDLADNMPKDVQTIIHTAASVKHYGSYDYFRRVNVKGTEHIVQYAASIGAKLIHISTLSVSGNSMADDFTIYRSDEEKQFYETSFYINQPLENVYIRSKFEAEKAVYDAMIEGLDAKVIRVGNLTNRESDFRFQPNYKENAFLTRVKAILEFGLFPDYLMPLYAEFSPIDLTAKGVVKIAQYAEQQNVFHLNSNRPVYFDRLIEIIHELGIQMKVVDGATFQNALQQTIKENATEYIFEAFQNDMDEQGKLVYDSNIRIRNDFTVWFLRKIGFEWNQTDWEYIEGYISYFRRIGYINV